MGGSCILKVATKHSFTSINISDQRYIVKRYTIFDCVKYTMKLLLDAHILAIDRLHRSKMMQEDFIKFQNLNAVFMVGHVQ
mgnify:CR=1 FL=1